MPALLGTIVCVDGVQCRLGHRQRLSGTGLDRKQFLFYAHATNRHCDWVPRNRLLIPRGEWRTG
jgi:hypothetical protein